MKNIAVTTILLVAYACNIWGQVAPFEKYYPLSENEVIHVTCENPGDKKFVLSLQSINLETLIDTAQIIDTLTNLESNYFIFHVKKDITKICDTVILKKNPFNNFLTLLYSDIKLHFTLAVVSETPTSGKIEIRKQIIQFEDDDTEDLSQKSVHSYYNDSISEDLKCTGCKKYWCRKNAVNLFRKKIYELDSLIEISIKHIKSISAASKDFDPLVLSNLASDLNYKYYYNNPRNLYSIIMDKKWLYHECLPDIRKGLDAVNFLTDSITKWTKIADKQKLVVRKRLAELDKQIGQDTIKLKQAKAALDTLSQNIERRKNKVNDCIRANNDCNKKPEVKNYWDKYWNIIDSIEMYRGAIQVEQYSSISKTEDKLSVYYSDNPIVTGLRNAIDRKYAELDDLQVPECLEESRECWGGVAETDALKTKYEIQDSLFRLRNEEHEELIKRYQQSQHDLDSLDQLQTSMATQKEVIEHQIKNDNVMNFDSVQLEFDGGTIKNILVSGEFKGEHKIFVNSEPIPFSALRDLSLHKNYFLYDVYEEKSSIPIKSVVFYTPHLHLKSEDYSPRDTEIVVKPDAPTRVMFKEPTRELLRAKIYTDFMGYVDGNPNGLVQTEISKKLNLWSKYNKYIRPRFGYLGPGKKNTSYVGWFNYYFPALVISKIESKDRALEILKTDTLVYYGESDSLQSDTSLKNKVAKNYVSTLDLYRHTFLSLKPLNFNILSLHFPVIKSSLHIDVGGSWHLAELKDSVFTKTTDSTTNVQVNKYPVSSTSFNAEVIWNFLPDPRFNASFSLNFIVFKMWSKKFEQAGDSELYKDHYDKRQPYYGILNPSFNVGYKPFKAVDGEIFFRFSYHCLMNDLKQNFMQTQMGLAFRFLK